MKRNSYFALAVCLLVAACFSGCHQSASSGEARRGYAGKKLDGAKRFERDGWVYVHLEGAPDKIGYQHGALLSKEIEDLLRVMGPFLQRQSKRDWNFYRESAEKMLWPKMDRSIRMRLTASSRARRRRASRLTATTWSP